MAALIHVYNVVIMPKIWIHALKCCISIICEKVLSSMLKDCTCEFIFVSSIMHTFEGIFKF